MKNNQIIIKQIINNLKIYSFDDESYRFIVEQTKNVFLHAMIFDDIQTITKILKNNQMEYFLDEDDFSITIKDELC